MVDYEILTQAKETVNSADTKSLVTLVASLVAAVASILVASLTIVFGRKNHKELIVEKRREERRKEIYKLLNEFYGPFQQYLNTSKEFYRILIKGKPKGFRTLPYLLDREALYLLENGTQAKVVFSKSDEEILTQIISIGKKLESLIVEKAGLIDDPVLRNDFVPDATITDVSLERNGLLAIAKAHFQIIRLAHKGAFSGETEKFKNYAFPRELPVRIEERIQALQQELKALNQ